VLVEADYDLLVVGQLMDQLQLGTKDILCFALEHLTPDIANEICDYKTTLITVSPVQEH
jgi:hypothetical protein